MDDLDALLSHFASRPRPHSKAILFVDNAGPDVVLGMIPFARELLKRGTQVVLAANAAPSINDITAPELGPLLARASGADALLARCLAERALRVASSGNDLGVIDLSRVSREIAAEAEEGCDLVVLEGMGRAIETNLGAAFACDSAKLGMIKVGARAPGRREGARAARRGRCAGRGATTALRCSTLSPCRNPHAIRSTRRWRGCSTGACTT